MPDDSDVAADEPQVTVQGLDAATRQRLIRLRALLAAAVASAGDGTAAGRHVAVIFMDGVCELALGLAAQQVGVEVGTKDGLLDVYSKVAGALGERWNRNGAKAVRELHLQRNTLQHHGVLPDQETMPVWAFEVESFVLGLIVAAFASDLHAVRGADAIDDDQLREDLRAAEEALGAGRFSESMRTSDRALGRVLDEFRSLRGRGSVGLFSHGVDQFDEFRAIDSAVGALEDFSDLLHLTTDPSERLWLDAALGQARRTGEEPARADAQRAYSFVLGCAMRYEAFRQRYPELRWEPGPAPDLEGDYRVPQIIDIQASGRATLAPGEMAIDVILDAVAPEWGDVSALHAAMRELPDVDLPKSLMPHVAGNVLTVTVSDSASPDEAYGWVRRLIETRHRMFHYVLRRRRERLRQLEGAASPYSDLIAADGPVRDASSEDVGGHLWIALTVILPDDAREYDVATALNERLIDDPAQGHKISLRNGRMTFAPDLLAADEVTGELARAVEDARLAEAGRQAKLDADSRRRDGLVRGLRETTRSAPANSDG